MQNVIIGEFSPILELEEGFTIPRNSQKEIQKLNQK